MRVTLVDPHETPALRLVADAGGLDADGDAIEPEHATAHPAERLA